MKLILAANTMEHPGFADFIRDAAIAHPDAAFAICGDLLNVFPEPGEDLRASIFYDLYGELIVQEMNRLRATHFAELDKSAFIAPLHAMFDVNGANFHRAKAIASRRYAAVFARLKTVLADRPLFFIPGNMDYPQLSALFASATSNAYQLDGDVISVGGINVGGVGGIPRSAQPFRDYVPISPYEMDDAEYARRLTQMWGVDLLLTHVSPDESPALAEFLRDSPVRAVICRAPFDLAQRGSCRGASQCLRPNGKMVLEVRPFDFPENFAFVAEISPGSEPQVDLFAWRSKTAYRQTSSPVLSA